MNTLTKISAYLMTSNWLQMLNSSPTAAAMNADDVLPEQINQSNFNGAKVRKGTVAAFLLNAKVWSDSSDSIGQRRGAKADMLDALPSLRASALLSHGGAQIHGFGPSFMAYRAYPPYMK